MLNRVILTVSFALVGLGLGWARADMALNTRARLGAGLTRYGTSGIVTGIKASAKVTTYTLDTHGGTVRVVALRAGKAQLGDEATFSCRPGSGLEPGRTDPTCLWATERSSGPGHGLAAFFAHVRAAVVSAFDSIFGQPASAWSSGLLVGDDSALPPDWTAVFKRTGTTHLTAVSGENLIYVLAFVVFLTNRLFYDRRARLAACGVAVLVFTAIAGAPASSLRAAAMYFAGRVATFVGGRPVSSLRSLFVSVVALVALTPTLLVFDRGFQLSALAVFGIAAFSTPLSGTVFRWLPKAPRRWAGETAAATLATSPLIAWMAGTYSVVALPANMIVLPMVGPITGVVGVMLVLTWIYQPAAALLAHVTEPVINLPPYILKWLSNLPFASVTGNLAMAILVVTTLAALVLTWLWCCKSGDAANLDLRN